MEELEFLARTAGIETVKVFTQQLDAPNPQTFIGSGKVNEVAAFAKDNEIDYIIFDDELKSIANAQPREGKLSARFSIGTC